MLLRLPAELLHEVFSFLLAATPKVHPPSSPGTKALLSLTLVCKITHHIANKLLIQRCFYVGSDQAAECVAEGLLNRFSHDNNKNEKNGLILEPTQAVIHIRELTVAEINTLEEALRWPHNVLDHHAKAFDTLFSRVGHCLKRLVLNSEFHADLTWEPRGPTNHRTREAFKQLTAIEEFYCIRADDNACCRGSYGDSIPIWAYWPKLRRLALFNPNLNCKEFLYSLGSRNNLTHLFIMSPVLSPLRFIPTILRYFRSRPRTIDNLTVARLVNNRIPPPHFGGADRAMEVTRFSKMSISARSAKKTMLMGLLPVAIHRDEVHGPERWFFELIQEGGVWDLEPTIDCFREEGQIRIEE